MRVLQLHNRAVRRGGGAEDVIESDASLLHSKGFEVEQLLIENAELSELSRARAGMKAIWNLTATRLLEARIDEFRPDIVHVHTPFPLMSPAVFRVASRKFVPTVATVHSYRYSCIKAVLYRDGRVCEVCVGKTLKLSGVRHRCYHDSILGSSAMTFSLTVHRGIGTFRNHVDVWLPISEFMRGKLVDEGLPPERMVVRANTTPDHGCRSDVGGDHALFAGRLVPEKGILTVLDAWRSSRDLPAITILGDGPLRDVVQTVADADDRVTFKGWLDQSDVRAEVEAARFLVLPSEWYEGGLPVIALQALAAGTPVIASDVGNFSAVIQPGLSGYLFRSGDPTSLSSTVERAWAASAPELEVLKNGARQLYEDRYSERRSAETLLDAYNKATRSRASRSRRPIGGRVR